MGGSCPGDHVDTGADGVVQVAGVVGGSFEPACEVVCWRALPLSGDAHVCASQDDSVQSSRRTPITGQSPGGAAMLVERPWRPVRATGCELGSIGPECRAGTTQFSICQETEMHLCLSASGICA